VEQTVYKIDSKGKLRFITISAVDDTIVQISGLLGGNPVSNISKCEGKNIGKTNSTTPQEQAIVETAAKIKKKLDEGYYITTEEAIQGTLILPMLAKEFQDDKVIYPCYVQPKLDGMRCLKERASMRSRKNKEIETVGHIAKEDSGDIILDGELYSHGLSFQENMKLIKKYRKNVTEAIRYHVYDVVLDKPFRERMIILQELLLTLKSNVILLVPTYTVNNKKELEAYHIQFIQEGYEGTIVRHTEASYEINKRSSQLLKYKDFLDETFTIVDILPSESRPEQGVIHCVGIGNQNQAFTFGCGMKFSHAEREEFLINKIDYIGKTAEVRFFELTDNGIPRFPVCVGIRLDK